MNITILPNRLRFTFILLTISICALAQEKSTENENDSIQYNQVYQALIKSEKQNTTLPVDSLLESNEIILDEYLAKLYYFKATFLAKKYNLTKYNATTDTVSFQTKTQEILRYFDLAIQKSDCYFLAKYQHRKYLFLLDLVEEYRNGLNQEFIIQYKSIKSQLKEKGLRPKRFGFGVTGDYHIGRQQWLGVGFSLMSGYNPSVKYKSICDGEMWKYKQDPRASGVNFFTFNYAFSLTNRLNDFSFSLIELYAPIRLVPTKFGYFKDPVSGGTNYYYRPGIGLNIGVFSISYSYNFIFKENLGTTSEKSFLGFEINYPIWNWYEPRLKK